MQRVFKLLVIGLIIIILLIATHYISWLAPVENLAVRAIEPVQKTTHSLTSGLRNFYSNWLSHRDLLSENEKLKEELKNIQLDQSQINSLKQENELLKRELRFVQQENFKFISARIITGVSDNLSRSVIINRGQKDGLQKGMAVVADEGILVGKIYEVSDNFSKVLLLTDNKSKVAATIQNQNQTVGLVEGQFGLSFTMTNIPQTAEVNENDLVVTSGLEGQIPKDLLIAKVDQVNQIESEIFKTAILTPIISFDHLSYVLVVVP